MILKTQDYIIYTDGGSRGNPGLSAYGFIIYDKNLKIIQEEGKPIGMSTNNVAEYMGVISALRWLLKNNRIENPIIQFYLDSTLVTNQMEGRFKIKNENLRNLYFTAKQLEEQIKGSMGYEAVRREKNKEADKLVNKALDDIPR